MIPFFLLFRNMFRVIRILFKQEEQKALMISVALLLFIGSFFYHTVEQMAYLDALYFSVMTLTTVGFGDFYPETAFGKIFTMMYVLVGIGMITGMIANFNQALMTHRRKEREKNSKKGQENDA